MITKKDPAALERGPGAYQITLWNFNYIACAHERVALVRIDCNSGGIQFRRFCLTCWAPIGSAIPHALAHAEEQRTGVQAAIADLDVIHAARDCYVRRERNGGLL